MRGKEHIPAVRGVVFVNLQKRYAVPTASLWGFARSLKRRLRLHHREFNVCFVDDSAIRHMNLEYRGKDKATDVLSFPWNEAGEVPTPEPPAGAARRGRGILANFLGDVVISVETARRNAAAEGHSTLLEIQWLILHGVLHLLGYDHERDSGEMVALELTIREQLDAMGGSPGEKTKSKVKTQKAKGKSQSRGRLYF
jgi:probable rRNA maturation factor